MTIDFIIAGISFLVISTFLYFSYMKKITSSKSKKKKKKEAKEIVEVRYLMLCHNLKKEKILIPKMILLISILDALIITTVFLVVVHIPYGLVWQLLTGFVLLLGLIYSIYNILGRILVKKGFDK